MKVLFLDVDGVLTNFPYLLLLYHKEQRKIIPEEQIDPNCMRQLKRIVEETNVKIVLSSSLRMTSFYETLMKVFHDYNLEIYDKTPYIEGKRGEEIRTWLKDHPEVESFAILDDKQFSDFYELSKYLVQTSYHETGLNEKKSDEVIHLLKKSYGRRKSEWI